MSQHKEQNSSRIVHREASSVVHANTADNARGVLRRLLFYGSKPVNLLANSWSLPVNFRYSPLSDISEASTWRPNASPHAVAHVMESATSVHAENNQPDFESLHDTPSIPNNAAPHIKAHVKEKTASVDAEDAQPNFESLHDISLNPNNTSSNVMADVMSHLMENISSVGVEDTQSDFESLHDTTPDPNDVFSINLPELDWVFSQDDTDETPVSLAQGQQVTLPDKDLFQTNSANMPDREATTDRNNFSLINPFSDDVSEIQEDKKPDIGLVVTQRGQQQQASAVLSSSHADIDTHPEDQTSNNSTPKVNDIQVPGVTAPENTPLERMKVNVAATANRMGQATPAVPVNMDGFNTHIPTDRQRSDSFPGVQQQVSSDASFRTDHPADYRKSGTTIVDTQIKSGTQTATLHRAPQTVAAKTGAAVNKAQPVNQRRVVFTKTLRSDTNIKSASDLTPLNHHIPIEPTMSFNTDTLIDKLHEVMSQRSASERTGERQQKPSATESMDRPEQEPPQVVRYVTVQRYKQNSGARQSMFWERSYLPRLTANMR